MYGVIRIWSIFVVFKRGYKFIRWLYWKLGVVEFLGFRGWVRDGWSSRGVIYYFILLLGVVFRFDSIGLFIWK